MGPRCDADVMLSISRTFIAFLAFLSFVFMPLIFDTWLVRVLASDHQAYKSFFYSFEIVSGLAWYLLLLLFLYFSFYWLCRRFLLKLLPASLHSMRGIRLLIDLLLILYVYASSLVLFPDSAFSYAVAFLPSPMPVFLVGSVLLLLALLRQLAQSKCIAGVALLLALVFLLPYGLLYAIKPSVLSQHIDRPHIVVIGVDSLSAYTAEQYSVQLPNISSLMASGYQYERAYTPLGRTFPAWVSLLTGLEVAEHRGVFNLSDRKQPALHDNFFKTLASQGYQGVYAMDERRFNNMGAEFGFDQVVGPRPGALDFLVHGLVDNPLGNLLLQWPGSRWLLPWSWNNVAAYSSYSADMFVKDVLAAIHTEQPLMLAVHFQSGHFPFKSRHMRDVFQHENQMFQRYIRALQVVDDQVAVLLAGLQQRGVLQNALVVVLADHGEALGELEADLQRNGEPFRVQSYGHGADLLSDHQNRIPLAFVRFLDGRPVGEPRQIKQHVSLNGVRDIIEHFAQTSDLLVMPETPCFFVETGLRIEAASDYTTLDDMDVASEGAIFYDLIDGELVLKADKLPQLLTAKDIGLRCRNRVTWFSARESVFYSVGLDAQGQPMTFIDVDEQDRRRINEYRQSYLNWTEDN